MAFVVSLGLTSAATAAVSCPAPTIVGDPLEDFPILSVSADITGPASLGDMNVLVFDDSRSLVAPNVDGTYTLTMGEFSVEASNPDYLIELPTCVNGNSASMGELISFTFGAVYQDKIAPVLVVPDTQTFEATGDLTSPVLVLATATDNWDENPVVDYSPKSFALGNTIVTWTATDASGNSVTGTSEVVINPKPTEAIPEPSQPVSHGGSSSRRRVQPSLAPNLGPAPEGQVLGAYTLRFSRTLAVGSSGEEVTELQNRLKSDGVYSGPVTGYFGALTEAGVKAFQAKNNLDQVGIVGPLTRQVLNGEAPVGQVGTLAAMQQQLMILLEKIKLMQAAQ